ncbi:hypothetical protein ACG74X_19650 [Marivita sp. S0852]|uniref:hypothetical protein n=1 Tax=Marivita sp. S0852 TaxID=3373893 RepID=UPI003981C933
MARPEEDDSEALYAMAEIVYNNPEMNLTSVIRIVMQSMARFHSEAAVIKRLRRKFVQHQDFLIDRVRADKARPVVYLPPKRTSQSVDLAALGLIGGAASAASALLTTSSVEQILDQHLSQQSAVEKLMADADMLTGVVPSLYNEMDAAHSAMLIAQKEVDILTGNYPELDTVYGAMQAARLEFDNMQAMLGSFYHLR